MLYRCLLQVYGGTCFSLPFVRGFLQELEKTSVGLWNHPGKTQQRSRDGGWPTHLGLNKPPPLLYNVSIRIHSSSFTHLITSISFA